MDYPRKLAEIIEPVRLDVKCKGFSQARIYRFELVWKKLEQYLLFHYDGYFTPERGERFLKEYCSLTEYSHLKSHEKIKVRAIFMLCDFYSDGVIHQQRTRLKQLCPADFEEVYERFIPYLKSRNLSEGSVGCYSMYVKKFLNFLQESGISFVTDISKSIILDYFSSFSRPDNNTAAPALIGHVSSALRNFFRYLYTDKIIDTNLSTCVPSRKSRASDKIPSAYSQNEVKRILNAINRSDSLGKRDYAMFLLAARLGLRSSDILNLKFKNLNWESGTITFCQVKTKEALELPLFEEIGEAIIDYLQHGRPEYESEYVFLRHTIPIGKMACNSLASRFYAYFGLAGISAPNGKQHGPHTLRHSLASALLKEQIPFPIIQKTLGHTNPNTTKMYTKIDVLDLKQCVLDVPIPCGRFAATLGKGCYHGS